MRSRARRCEGKPASISHSAVCFVRLQSLFWENNHLLVMSYSEHARRLVPLCDVLYGLVGDLLSWCRQVNGTGEAPARSTREGAPRDPAAAPAGPAPARPLPFPSGFQAESQVFWGHSPGSSVTTCTPMLFSPQLASVDVNPKSERNFSPLGLDYQSCPTAEDCTDNAVDSFWKRASIQVTVAAGTETETAASLRISESPRLRSLLLAAVRAEWAKARSA